MKVLALALAIVTLVAAKGRSGDRSSGFHEGCTRSTTGGQRDNSGAGQSGCKAYSNWTRCGAAISPGDKKSFSARGCKFRSEDDAVTSQLTKTLGNQWSKVGSGACGACTYKWRFCTDKGPKGLLRDRAERQVCEENRNACKLNTVKDSCDFFKPPSGLKGTFLRNWSLKSPFTCQKDGTSCFCCCQGYSPRKNGTGWICERAGSDVRAATTNAGTSSSVTTASTTTAAPTTTTTIAAPTTTTTTAAPTTTTITDAPVCSGSFSVSGCTDNLCNLTATWEAKNDPTNKRVVFNITTIPGFDGNTLGRLWIGVGLSAQQSSVTKDLLVMVTEFTVVNQMSGTFDAQTGIASFPSDESGFIRAPVPGTQNDRIATGLLSLSCNKTVSGFQSDICQQPLYFTWITQPVVMTYDDPEAWSPIPTFPAVPATNILTVESPISLTGCFA